MEFGEFLREKREAKRMSIRKLALYAGCSDSYLSLLERGIRGKKGPTPAFLRKLAAPLGVPYEVMMAAAGYHLPMSDAQLYSGAIIQFLRESIGERSEQFAEHVGISLDEVEVLEEKGVSFETLQKIFDRLFGMQRRLSPAQKELLLRMERAFQRYANDTSLKVEKVIHAVLDMAEEAQPEY